LQGDTFNNEMDKPLKVAIVGLGYVGLPLSVQFSRSGVHVLGLDIDADKVLALNQGRTYIRHVPAETIAEQVTAKRLAATTDFARICEVQAVIICVPTPLNKNREPDISYVLETGRAIAPHIRQSTLVVLESTTYPGTTDEDLRAVLEAGSGMKAGKDFHLAFSPEREDPANPASKVGEVPKIVGGFTKPCLEKAMQVYGRAIKHLVPVSSCRVAEAAKLLENIFRSVNIALVNELKLVYASMGIDIWEVIEAAKTKPFGFMPFYPGPGLGGHCIPIDPFYLTWKAREYDIPTRFIELAGEINARMPHLVVAKLAEAIDRRQGKGLTGARILILGLAYKKNVDDMRESPSLKLIELIEARGASVDYHDPFVPMIPPTRDHAALAGRLSVPLTSSAMRNYDAVLIATDHDDIDYGAVVKHSKLVVDTRNACARAGLIQDWIVKA
jgi:UDP-N-acetyl-D-glucosamine dehydrogenase